MDVVDFCSNLIGCRSVTPCDDGAVEYIANFLQSIGFETKILTFAKEDGSNVIKNLFAKFGNSKKILGFVGHSDVVPAGDSWDTDPFVATKKDGYLIGRGAADMKGGISAFCCAVEKFLKNNKKNDYSFMFFITGDEEIGSQQGMPALLQWCNEHGYIPTDCIVGEPSSYKKIGDRVYIGHRGSLNIVIKYVGKQGHTAYPENFDNSLSHICRFVTYMLDYKWKHEQTLYPNTSIEPTLLFTNNYAENVAPDCSSVNFNIRFGSDYTAEDIVQIIKTEAEKFNFSVELIQMSGNAYMCDDLKLKIILSNAIKRVTNLIPEFSASGGISDGRYMISYCNIIEFGLLDALIHQKNEKVPTEDLRILEKIYLQFINNYFN